MSTTGAASLTSTSRASTSASEPQYCPSDANGDGSVVVERRVGQRMERFSVVRSHRVDVLLAAFEAIFEVSPITSPSARGGSAASRITLTRPSPASISGMPVSGQTWSVREPGQSLPGDADGRDQGPVRLVRGEGCDVVT